ncbi:MAG: hypothetical protein WCE42_09490, partial [Rhizobium ruizarguesonis]
ITHRFNASGIQISKLGSFPVVERSCFRQNVEVEAWHSKSFKARQDKSFILPFRSVQINSIGHAFVIRADAPAATVRNRTDSWHREVIGLSFNVGFNSRLTRSGDA